MSRSPQSTPSWLRVALGLTVVAAVVAAVLVVGPASSAVQVSRRVITVEKGVVQSTVSASGSLQPANELNVNFKTGGTLLAVDVHQGEHVYEGQLLAELDPQSTNVAVEQAQAGVDAAQAKLAQVESDPTSSSASSSGGGSSGAGANASASAAVAPTATTAAYTAKAPARAVIADAPTTTTTTPTPTPTPTSTTTTPAAATPQKQAPAAPTKKATTTKATTTKAATTKSTTTSPAATTVSPATQAANIASARAAVDSAELSLKAAEITRDNTKLYAPANGTIATLAGVQPGDTVSAGATGAAAAASSAASGSGSGSGNGGGTSSAAASSSGSSSQAFIVLVDLSGMDLVVPLSESDITKVKVGQAASVTVNALTSSDFAGHVTSVATLPSTSSGVVSYDVTVHLDQLEYGLLPGMTASAQIVVSQAQGAVSLPSAAISRTGGQSTVTVVKNGKDVVQPVVTGIVGDSATQVVSGLSGGEQVVISTSTNLGASATTGAAGAAAGGFGARALGGGGGGFGGGGGGGGGAARRGGG